MKVKVGHREILEKIELEDLISKEVTNFCLAFQKSLERLLEDFVELEIIQKTWGVVLQYQYQKNLRKWYFQFELYYPNQGYEQKINYIKINRFITLPTNLGSGRKVFKAFKVCCEQLKELEMIRLHSVRKATSFWKGVGFREQEEWQNWIKGESFFYDLSCLKRPISLEKCQFIYDIKYCKCSSCAAYQKFNSDEE